MSEASPRPCPTSFRQEAYAALKRAITAMDIYDHVSPSGVASAGTKIWAVLHAAGGALLAGRFTTIPHIKSAAPPQPCDQV